MNPLNYLLPYLPHFAAASSSDCKLDGGGFLGLPTWYKYLSGVQVYVNDSLQCNVRINGINDIWLIVAAVLELLLRIGALVAIAMVIVGGVSYITSEGNPDKAKKALNTLISAVIGLAITIGAASIVAFVAGRFN